MSNPPINAADRLAAWKAFVDHNRLAPSLDPLVAHSWQRCSPRLNPRSKPRLFHLSSENLLATQIASFNLISIARPIMEDIHQFVEESDTLVVLVNGAGFFLDVFGDAHMDATARMYELTTGVSISEGQIGTNAFTLALTERIPASVVGPDHFLEYFHNLADVAAPIFDPTGRPLGALGVLTLADNYHPHSLGLVVAGARAVEGQRQAELLLQEQNIQLAELNAILATISEGILVWNAEGVLMHANNAATKILGQTAVSLVGRPLEDSLQLPALLKEALLEGRALSDVDITLDFDDRSVNCVASLRFVHSSQGTQWVILTLREAEEVRQLIHHQMGPQVSVSIDDFVGESHQIRRLRRLANTAAPAKASVLIRGESGTGKDYLARALHNAGPRRDAPFIIFSCSSVPNELIVGELLGYEESAAPGKTGGRPSKFELAHSGTLFFQDIEALTLEAQSTLLNVLEMGIVQRLGSSRPIDVDVRIIAATLANLEKQVAEGSFRADLFYRLSPFEIVLPPLRERVADLPIFVEKILQRLSRQHNRPLGLAPGVMDILRNYSWPGNTRELEATLERAAIQAGVSELIGSMHLPDFIRQPTRTGFQSKTTSQVPTLEAMEREAIIQAARNCNGNVSEMARVLGIGRTTVWRKLKELNISADHFRR